ncbi:MULTISPECIES: heme ABC transporter substrate-binding protein IsdE [Aedoeadaptatus]|uniref:High-affinity heme uptake system protein IsdE n=1 Tax=Aedoeadaptatus acetigenes TaxID=2981723 RepID=A0ABV1J8B7_9FIRM|nr:MULTISPECIES: heme ABC transporter substrate-binding protein IsdE [Peptoniphilaceae]MBS6524752.1 heme ABC transporter substrate-binding protein IsdE [Peptoniphilaceae bacterium]MCU6786016.1 heme ABC transporter substrate-binding protein IsdE [Aedoeadaptatus acetigenes]
MKTSVLKIFSIAFILVLLTGCVNQKEKQQKRIDGDHARIITTSAACADIMDKLDVDLVAIAESQLQPPPERYKNLPTIGMAMSPDMEKISSMNPDYVFSPASLMPDLLPKYQAAGIHFGFVNLSNVPGMYRSIEDLGRLLNREKEAEVLVKDYEDFMKDFKSRNKGPAPRVLILMGLPGSYVVATDKSYVGSLVKLAGGENVYPDEDQQFLTVNTEDMLEKDPDIILRTAHAMPEKVHEMFQDEFKTNDVWKHFRAVKEDKVFDLNTKLFGMSANFSYKEALGDLEKVFYGQGN